MPPLNFIYCTSNIPVAYPILSGTILKCHPSISHGSTGQLSTFLLRLESPPCSLVFFVYLILIGGGKRKGKIWLPNVPTVKPETENGNSKFFTVQELWLDGMVRKDC